LHESKVSHDGVDNFAVCIEDFVDHGC
jgi:hypothetical protein